MLWNGLKIAGMISMTTRQLMVLRGLAAAAVIGSFAAVHGRGLRGIPVLLFDSVAHEHTHGVVTVYALHGIFLDSHIHLYATELKDEQYLLH
jgi:hypothetical protein